MKIQRIVLLAVLLVVSASASAQATPDSVVNMVTLAMKPAMATLTTTAIAWLGAFATLQFIFTNFSLLKSGGDLDAVYAKLAGSFFWFGMCFYILINGPDFIAKVGDSFFNIIGTNLPSATDMILDALVLVGKMVVASMVGAAIPAVGNTLGPMIVYIMIFNFAVSLFFAFKIFMIQLELGLIVMLSPLSFSLLGLNALKDQGIAPLKSLISLGYRIILMTVIMGAYAQVSSVVGDEFAKFGDLSASDLIGSGIADLMKTVISAFGAYLVLAYLLWKSDSIAATLSGGGTSMGTADIASAAAMGAAAGAAVASGGAATGAAAAKPVQGMADFMKSLSGSSSMSNASSRGSGMPVGVAPTPSASNSLGSNTATNAGAPQFETNSSGAPMRPASNPSNPSNQDQPANSNSGSTASILGGDGKNSNQPETEKSKPGGQFWGDLKNLGKHIEQDKAATHASINTHHSD